MRHRIAWVAAVAALALALAGCGSDDGGESDAGGGAEAGALPVTIEHRSGATEIIAAPERVVAVGLSDIDAVLALGVAPVGVTDSDERLGLLDRDLLLWNIGFAPGVEDQLAGNRLSRSLRVAREGRDLFLTDPVLSGALTFSTVLSIPYAIDGLVPQIVAAIDGDPATEPAKTTSG